MELTHGSLFAGIGGFDLGFERAGFKTLWQVERDPYCLKVLEKHWPDARRYTDVRTFLNESPARPDILSGGFPCQDISHAGGGAGLAGERSGLWAWYFRAICELRPRFAVVENVSALLFRGLGRVLSDLSEVGYDAEWETLPAHAFGAPHLRERVFLIAYPHALNGQAGLGLITHGAIARLEDGLRQSHELWLQTQPTPHGVDDGLPRGSYLHRVGALGNAIVPQIAEFIAWQIRGAIEMTPPTPRGK